MQVRTYIADTDAHVTIILDKKRNSIMRFQLVIIIVGFLLTIGTAITGLFGMNIKIDLFEKKGIFEIVTYGTILGSIFLFCPIMAYSAKFAKQANKITKL